MEVLLEFLKEHPDVRVSFSFDGDAVYTLKMIANNGYVISHCCSEEQLYTSTYKSAELARNILDTMVLKLKAGDQ